MENTKQTAFSEKDIKEILLKQAEDDYEKAICTARKEKLKHEFKPFDKVLVRMNDDEYNVLHEVWMPAIFEFYTDNADYPYAANLLWWKYCIPYEENQELVGTYNEPKEE